MAKQKFEYVPRKTVSELRRMIIELLKLVQNDLRDKFTFSYTFDIGSSTYNLVVTDVNGNGGFDIDCDLHINVLDDSYTAKEIRTMIIESINKFKKMFNFNKSSDTTRVYTIALVDRNNKKRIFHVDFAFIREYYDENGEFYTEYIHHYDNGGYGWCLESSRYLAFRDQQKFCKRNGLWNEVRDNYLEKKNNNRNNLESHELYLAAVNEVAMDNGYKGRSY